VDDVAQKASEYLKYCINKDNAHYLTAERALKWHNRLGIPAVVAGTIVSTSIFATLEKNPALGWKLATGIIALLAAVLAGLQTFLRSSERAQKHVGAAIGYSQERRRLELFLLKYGQVENSQRDAALRELSEITSRLDELDAMSLLIPTKLYDRARLRSASRGAMAGEASQPSGAQRGGQA